MFYLVAALRRIACQFVLIYGSSHRSCARRYGIYMALLNFRHTHAALWRCGPLGNYLPSNLYSFVTRVAAGQSSICHTINLKTSHRVTISVWLMNVAFDGLSQFWGIMFGRVKLSFEFSVQVKRQASDVTNDKTAMCRMPMARWSFHPITSIGTLLYILFGWPEKEIWLI